MSNKMRNKRVITSVRAVAQAYHSLAAQGIHNSYVIDKAKIDGSSQAGLMTKPIRVLADRTQPET